MGIRLVPHDPTWADRYERAAADIRDALGGTALSIDHVGSTAIPGIDAKPVIDILVVVETYEPEAAYRIPLESLGYVFLHRDEIHAFFEGHPVGMATQVGVEEKSSEDPGRMIAFRDYLRTHPDEAARYEHLKHALADRYSDGNAYADAKSEYVNGVVRRAQA
ncbi:MAG TPA: GrpB family protein [Actinomycetota bacterium]|nr:GrpB family protein [Actinomycetota bacterium]